ncbi:hypothetical protein ACHAP4_011553 [Fusarium culmorum]
MIEYIEGHDGELQSKEIYILVLDAVPMAIASTMLFNVFHPSKFLNGTSENLADSETEDALGYWQGHSLGTVGIRNVDSFTTSDPSQVKDGLQGMQKKSN